MADDYFQFVKKQRNRLVWSGRKYNGKQEELARASPFLRIRAEILSMKTRGKRSDLNHRELTDMNYHLVAAVADYL